MSTERTTSALSGTTTTSAGTRTVRAAFRDLYVYRELLLNLTRRELRSRFRRSFLGWGWSFMQPVLMTAVYALVLGTFLKVDPPVGDPSGIQNYAFFLLAGVIPWNLFAGGLGSSVGSVANAGGLITRVWFPRELLPMASILALGFSMVIEVAVLAVAVTAFYQVMLLQYLPVLVLVALMQIMFTAGVSFWLAACNVKFKDVEYLVSVFLLAYFYLTPILYPASFIPDTPVFGSPFTWRDVALLNPMARFSMAYRNVLYDVTVPGLETTLFLVFWSVLVFLLGFRFFARRADRFAEAM